MKFQTFSLACVISALALTFAGPDASAAIIIDGAIGGSEYSLSASDGDDSATDFAGSDIDVDKAYFGFPEGEDFVASFDVLGANGFDAAVTGEPTVVTISLYDDASDPAPQYSVAMNFYAGTTTPSFVTLLDLNDGGSFLTAGDYTLSIGDAFEFSLPLSMLSDLFPSAASTTNFAASIQIDQDFSNHNEEVSASFTNVPIPEPATAALLALGGATMLTGNLRRRKKA